MPAVKSLVGRVFGRLTVLGPTGEIGPRGGAWYWTCRCECGTETVVYRSNLETGNTISCGCARVDAASVNQKTHGKSGTPEHRAWKSMRQRCLNPKNRLYKYWGGRGITICKRWGKFENFLADMGPIPGPGYSLEREKVNGNYCKANCKWIPRTKQSRNRRDSTRLTLNGVTRCLADWADHLGVSYQLLRGRVSQRRDSGWTDEQILTTPNRFG
jgi:hypothetical protein